MTINIHDGIPNLDKQTIQNLELFVREVHLNPTKIARVLFPQMDLVEAVKVTHRLGDYANARALQMTAVDQGMKLKYKVHTEQCVNIRSSLPTYAQW